MLELNFFANFKNKLFYLWFRVVLWCTIIFCLSAIPNYRGMDPNFETLWGILEFSARKSAHLCEYAVLFIFIYRAMEKTWENRSQGQFLFSFCISILYALSDEIHQTFVFGRNGSSMDIFIDAVGSLIGYFFLIKIDRKLSQYT